MWERVGDRTELHHIDPHSNGHQRFFPVLLGCSTGGLGTQPFWDMFLNPASSLQLVWSPTDLISNCNCSIGGLRAHSAGCWLSLPHLVSNWSDLQTDWISCALSNIIVQRPPSFCGRLNFTLIQPVHGQGYNILIDRMHHLFTQVRFLFWQPGRVVGQYTTLGTIHCLKTND